MIGKNKHFVWLLEKTPHIKSVAIRGPIRS